MKLSQLCAGLFLLSLTTIIFSKAIIDPDVLQEIQVAKKLNLTSSVNKSIFIIVFLNDTIQKKNFRSHS